MVDYNTGTKSIKCECSISFRELDDDYHGYWYILKETIKGFPHCIRAFKRTVSNIRCQNEIYNNLTEEIRDEIDKKILKDIEEEVEKLKQIQPDKLYIIKNGVYIPSYFLKGDDIYQFNAEYNFDNWKE